jgi:predicted DCC family thiol-disulfide oxidoreductase YuxK
VNFIIDRDPKEKFHFAPLQSTVGQRLLNQYRLPNNLDTVVYISQDGVYTKSEAALRVARELSGLWFLLFYMFICVPLFIRDGAYDLFARHRYRLFGEADSCRAPTKAFRLRFLEDSYTHE